MASYFLLTLQTQPPVIEVIMPPYCAPGDTVDIVIQANVVLSSYQSMSMTNCHGVTTPLIFLYDNGVFRGSIPFTEDDGYVTFDFGTFKDEVDNVSAHITGGIQVFLTQALMIDVDTIIQTIETDVYTMYIQTADETRVVDANSLTQSITTDSLTQSIECGVIKW